MRGLSSLERIILECLGKQKMTYEEIQKQSGLHENVCFNILQALIIRGILATEANLYKVSENLSPFILEDINGVEARKAESLELMEAVMEQKGDRVFRIQKGALDSRDEKIFLAMLTNIESFLRDSHKKAQGNIPLKERKVIFWGVGEVQALMNQVISGRNA
jgi:hypothetical protein